MSVDLNVPSNLEAEQAVLGAIMVDREQLALVRGMLDTDDFQDAGHAAIFATMKALGEAGEPIDKVSIATELRKRGVLEQVGGLATLTVLLNAVPTTANTEYYADAVAKTATQRRLMTAFGKYERRAANDEPSDVCRAALDEINAITQRASHVKSHTLFEALQLIDRRRKEVGSSPGIPYPLDSLNRGSAPYDHSHERGMRPGGITIIAARTKIGKSALLEMTAAAAALEHRVILFALEMGMDDTLDRMSERTSYHRLTGRLESDDFRIVDNDVSIGVDQIAAQCAQHRPEVVLIDHAQHIRGWFEGQRGEGRDMAPTRILYRLKAIATRFHCHVVLAQQINRNVDSNEPPTLNDIRDTGTFEQIAHRVILLHRPHYGEDGEDNEIVWNIAANRSGAPSHQSCVWQGRTREIFDRVAVAGAA